MAKSNLSDEKRLISYIPLVMESFYEKWKCDECKTSWWAEFDCKCPECGHGTADQANEIPDSNRLVEKPEDEQISRMAPPPGYLREVRPSSASKVTELHDRNLVLDIFDELIVDNFAGGGGASTGIWQALGRHVDHAINHSREALGMHRINHPQTIHHCEDIFDVDPLKLVEGRPVGLAWLSPDCKHFSKAKGGKPLDKHIRGLLYVMFRWAKIRSRVMMMENVEEIKTLGHLFETHSNGCKGGKDCKKGCHWGRPIPAEKGKGWQTVLDILGPGVSPDNGYLPEILDALGDTVTKAELVRGFGYKVEHRELRMCDYGAPTIRKRLFLVARCDGRPIVWPAAEFINPKAKGKAGSLQHKLAAATEHRVKYKPWRIIADCIDWDRPCPSIFLNKEQAKKARCRRPLAKSTLKRIATGIDRYVLKATEPFLVSINCSGGEHRGTMDSPGGITGEYAKNTSPTRTGPFLASLTHQGGERVEQVDEPAKTITGAHRGEKALVAPVMSKFHGDHAGRSDGAHRGQTVEEPLKTQDVSNRFAVTEAKLVAPALTREFGQSIGQRADEPAPTVMPAGQGKTSLVETKLAPFITEHANASVQRNRPVDEPSNTLCAEVKGGHYALVSANLMVNTSGHTGAAAAEPSPTIPTGGHHALVTGAMVQTGHYKTNSQMVKGVDEPMRTQATAPSHAVVTGTLVGSGGRAAQSRPRGVDEPNHTGTAKADQCLAAVHLTKFTTGGVGQDMREPGPTVCAGAHSPDTHGGAASTQGIVAATLVGAGGPEYSGKPKPVDAPLHTLTTESHDNLAAATLVKLRGGVETHNKPEAADEPLGVVSAGGTHHAVVTGTLVHTAHGECDKNGKKRGRGARDVTESMPSVLASPDAAIASAYLAQHNGGFNTTPGHDAREPISTVSAKGSQQQVVAASMAAYYGNDEDGQAVTQPARTVTTKERFGLVESTLEEGGAGAHGVTRPTYPTMTEEQIAGARMVAAFLREHGVVFEGEFATVGGYVIVDIGMRMLTPRELFRAQGFPNDYVIDKAVVVDPKTGDSVQITLTKEQQIRMCGNSVCPPGAAALVRANMPDLAIWEVRAARASQRKAKAPSETPAMSEQGNLQHSTFNLQLL